MIWGNAGCAAVASTWRGQRRLINSAHNWQACKLIVWYRVASDFRSPMNYFVNALALDCYGVDFQFQIASFGILVSNSGAFIFQMSEFKFENFSVRTTKVIPVFVSRLNWNMSEQVHQTVRWILEKSGRIRPHLRLQGKGWSLLKTLPRQDCLGMILRLAPRCHRASSTSSTSWRWWEWPHWWRRRRSRNTR